MTEETATRADPYDFIKAAMCPECSGTGMMVSRLTTITHHGDCRFQPISAANLQRALAKL